MGRGLTDLWTERKFSGKNLQSAERLGIDAVLLEQASKLPPLLAGRHGRMRDVAAVLVHHAFEIPALERRDRFLLERVKRASGLWNRHRGVDREAEIVGRDGR